MKVTIARKIAFLLLLFNLGSVSSLIIVGWMYSRYSPDRDFQDAALKQRDVAWQIYEVVRLHPRDWPPTLNTLIQDFDHAARETKLRLSRIPLSAGNGAARAEKVNAERMLAKVEKDWNNLRPQLLHVIYRAGTADEVERGLAEVRTEASVLAGTSGRVVGKAFAIGNIVRRERIVGTLLIVCAVNIGLFFAGIYLTKLYLARPVRLVTEGALALRSGNYAHRIPVVTRDELATLAETFNGMSVSIGELLAERDRAEEALRASEANYRLLFENNPQPMWVFDRDTLAFLAVNDAAIRQYGYSREEFLSMTVTQLRPAEDVPLLLRQMAGYRDEPMVFGTARHVRKDGSIVEADVFAHKLSFGSRPAGLVVAHDVTEKKKIEQELLHSQKQEAVGRLAGGIAHDFNNVLTIISGYSDLLLEQTAAHHPARGKIQGIRKAALRAAALTRHLLAFSRKQVLQPKVVDVNAIIRSNCDVWSRLLGADIILNAVLCRNPWPVRLDPTQFEQVLLNLCINARDAMPGGGRLTIQTAKVKAGQTKKFRDGRSLDGPGVTVSVTDTGCGMDKETISKIFEPFFTTKPVGRGTGLGLSTVYGIVQQSGGHISVESEPGRGTAFAIYFPAVVDADPHMEPALVTTAIAKGSEVILFAEDDADVRALVSRTLEEAGYMVLAAGNGSEALRIAQEHMGQIDPLLTDVVMPGMNGKKLSYEIRRVRPAIKILFVSGYVEDVPEGVPFLQKPFPLEDVRLRVREVLDTVPA